MDPPDTKAANVSLAPFAGVEDVAVRVVVVAAGGGGGCDPPPFDPPPQLVMPTVNSVIAAIQSPNVLRHRFGAKIRTRKAQEMPPPPIIQVILCGVVCASTGTRTS